MKQAVFYKRLNLTVFTLVMVFLYIPILILIIFSFNDSKIVDGWKGFTFKYYQLLFQNEQIATAFRHTLLIAVTSTITSTVLGVLAALGLENKRFRGRKAMHALVYVPLIMPDILMGVSLALLFNFMRV